MAQRGELLRLLEELDHFLQFLLGFVRAGHSAKVTVGRSAFSSLRPAAAKLHGAVLACAACLAHDKDEEAEMSTIGNSMISQLKMAPVLGVVSTRIGSVSNRSWLTPKARKVTKRLWSVSLRL